MAHFCDAQKALRNIGALTIQDGMNTDQIVNILSEGIHQALMMKDNHQQETSQEDSSLVQQLIEVRKLIESMQEKQQINNNQENTPYSNTTVNVVTQSYQPMTQLQPFQQMVQQPLSNMANLQYPVHQQPQLYQANYQANNKQCQKKRGRNHQQQPQSSGQQNQVIQQQQQGGNPQHNQFTHNI
eukprot:9317488-Ditylum_brightwellii.AAC.1